MTEKKPVPDTPCHSATPLLSYQSAAFTLAAQAQIKLQARQCQRARQPPRVRQRAHELSLSPTQQQGLQAEHRAIEWLCAQGLQLLGTNLRCRYGELDAVFRADAHTLVIVEIRRRGNTRHGGAAASITYAKQQRVRKTAAWFLPQLTATGFAGKTPHCRFDAVCIEGDTLNWLQAAF